MIVSHKIGTVYVLVSQFCPTLCDPMDCSLPGSFLSPWDFPGKDAGVICHFLHQGIVPTQGLNLGLLYCRQILYQLSYQGRERDIKSSCFILTLNRNIMTSEFKELTFGAIPWKSFFLNVLILTIFLAC